MRTFARAAPWIATLTLAAGASACFYDSRWVSQQQARAAAVERAKPAELHATLGETDVPARKADRVLRVRAHATARYAAEVVDWPRQLAQLLDAAGEVIGPTLGVRLEIATTATWAPRGGEDDLAARLDELAAADDGRDVEWVIGLLGSVPRAELSYHQLGMGRRPGKHLVMRAMNDAREHEAIERGFTWLDANERLALYRTRKRHKTTTVLLHELGHTLGVPHEVDTASIMHARYDPKATGFSEAAAGLMRLSLAHRLEPAAQTEQAFGAALLGHVERTAAAWVPAERDELLAQLRAAVPRAPAAPPSGRPRRNLGTDEPMPAAEDPLAALAIIDRNTFNRAVAAQQAGRVLEAWGAAKPLFIAYPDVYAVQDLRCQLAMAAGLSFAEVEAHCARMMELSGIKGKRK